MTSNVIGCPSHSRLTTPGIRIMNKEFEKYLDFNMNCDDIYNECPNFTNFSDGGEAVVGIYKPSVATPDAFEVSGDKAYDEDKIWKAACIVIARFNRDYNHEIMHDREGIPEIILVVLPWNAGSYKMRNDQLLMDGTLAPFLQISDWTSVPLRNERLSTDRSLG